MLKVDLEQDDDGRWIAEVFALPGVIVYGDTRAEAEHKATTLVLRVIADRMEHNEPVPDALRSFIAAEPA